MIGPPIAHQTDLGGRGGFFPDRRWLDFVEQLRDPELRCENTKHRAMELDWCLIDDELITLADGLPVIGEYMVSNTRNSATASKLARVMPRGGCHSAIGQIGVHLPGVTPSTRNFNPTR